MWLQDLVLDNHQRSLFKEFLKPALQRQVEDQESGKALIRRPFSQQQLLIIQMDNRVNQALLQMAILIQDWIYNKTRIKG